MKTKLWSDTPANYLKASSLMKFCRKNWCVYFSIFCLSSVAHFEYSTDSEQLFLCRI